MCKDRFLRIAKAWVWGVFAVQLLAGCGNELDCALNGNNLKGRVTFAGNVPVQTGTTVVVQWSRDSFATVSGHTTSAANVQGLLSIPYGLCVDTDVNIQVRAFEDTNGNSSPDTGEPSGRYDQTSNGNGNFVDVLVHSTSSGNSSSSRDVKEGVDIALDTP